MADPVTVLERLRSQANHSETLATLLTQTLLETPAQQLIEPTEVVQGLHWALGTLAQHPHLVTRAIETIDQQLAALSPEQLQRCLGEALPMTVVFPIQTLLGTQIAPDRSILAACLDHAGMRELIQELLTHELAAFGTKLRKLVPDKAPPVPGRKLASRLAGVAKGVAAAVGSEIERQMEDRARDFVDDALSRSTGRMIDRMASEDFAPQLATWRVDVLHALLSLPAHHFRNEWDKLDKDALAQSVSDAAAALVQWEGFVPMLEAVSQQAWPTFASATLSDLLEPAGASQGLQSRIKDPMTRIIDRVVARPEFGTWLEKLHQS